MERVTKQERFQKKSVGSFYTPSYLATLIAEESLNAWLRNHTKTGEGELLKLVQNLKILDPSAGAGAFLLAAANWLDKKLQELGDKSSITRRRESIVRDSLYGVDLVPEAVAECRLSLLQWVGKNVTDNIKIGNSLTSYDWTSDFSSVTTRENPGFDVILGNPPYGNILSKEDRKFIQKTYPFVVGGTRTGTWNSAAHFIVRSSMLLRQDGELGFLIPNSILRVKQFTKTRQFLIDCLRPWKISDEGSPFDDVTLEMVTVFCTKQKSSISDTVEVESRRPGYEQKNSITMKLLKTSRIFSLYHDEIFEAILKRGQKNLLVATRGRDIPKAYIKQEVTGQYNIPYITSGRSVRRYHIDRRYQTYTDDWYKRNDGTRVSFSNEMLVATKNYRYPRCVIKPEGIIHGGGIVHVKSSIEDVNLRALGLILNSRLIQYICTRYLTNYSQLTTCLNTGILEELPIVLPEYPNSYSILFDALSKLYNDEEFPERESCIKIIEAICEALVYELYFGKDNSLQKDLADLIEADERCSQNVHDLCDLVKNKSIGSRTKKIMGMSIVEKIELRLNDATGKSPRY
ncbi:MAG: N-6 DNA methylase [Candidatus Thorarchaeota archaeon]